MSAHSLCSIVVLSLALSSPSIGGVVYDEGASGDLSNSGLSPTKITVAQGSNEIHGVTGANPSIDRDYFSVDIPVGLQLTAIKVLPDTSVGGEFSFIGIQAGSQVTVPSNAFSATGLLGWWHFSDGDINTDILGSMGIPSAGSSGFTPPLNAGPYAFWIQDFNSGTTPYGFELTLTPVPLPAALLLFASSLGFLGLLGRRRPG